METAFASFAAGAVEAVVVQPLDFIKVRHQINEARNEGVGRSAAAILREGGPARFYRGAAPEISSVIAGRAVCFMCYETVKEAVEGTFGKGGAVLQGSVAGALSAVPEAVVVTPFQVVKVRMQSKEHLQRYPSLRSCVADTYRRESLGGFTHGLRATVYRNSVWTAIYFATIAYVSRIEVAGCRPPDFVSGFVAGAWAVLFNAPFDVVKSRQQNALGGAGGVLSCARAVVDTEGFSGLYKGVVPKLWRMGLGGAISLATFTSTKRLLGSGSTFD
ncbi:putative mitochondrial 2-oxodicarboxylate carrier [Diplonema papillatum]|nr:putative mitochondrial 2-oxodicarboxylate carrier [Diplonema papillatum]|eukprot:gene19193-29552_t